MDIFEELGLHRYLNAQDTFTKYGASCMPDVSLRAMQEIASSYVDLAEVQVKAGDALAVMTNNEAAYISNGAAGGLMIATAAAMARDDEEVFHRLPETTGEHEEVIFHTSQHNAYDRSCATVGAKIVHVGTANSAPTEDEFLAAIHPNTAAIVYFIYFGRDAALPLDRVIALAHSKGVPVIVDAAAQNPPASNLWRFTQMGADMVIFSGGKTIRGPQDSGLIVGKKEWIERCRRFGPPTDGVCRGCKTSREAIVGLYKAVQLYLQQDEDTVQGELFARCQIVATELEQLGFTDIHIGTEGPVGQQMSRVFARVPYGDAGQLADNMREQGVYIGAESDDHIMINPLMLTVEQTQDVCRILESSLRELA